MIICPVCHSATIISNQPIRSDHIDRARDFTKIGTGLSDPRYAKVMGLVTLAMVGINSFYKECRCTACHATFDYVDCEHPGHA